MESAVKQRIMEFIRYKRMPVVKFESICGLSCGYIRNMRKGFGVQKLDSILNKFPELNPMWLLYGDGEMLLRKEQKSEETEKIPTEVQSTAECIDCRILQVRLEEKEAVITNLKEQLEQATEQNRALLSLLKSSIAPASVEDKKKII